MKKSLTIRDLYPDLSPKELEEVHDNLDRYLLLMLRIFERLEEERSEKSDLP